MVCYLISLFNQKKGIFVVTYTLQLFQAPKYENVALHVWLYIDLGLTGV